ncbi:MAG: prohibitin family protein [Clostridiales bacterium]|nr:prohibitin family protein [Clostridiales bacterium]
MESKKRGGTPKRIVFWVVIVVVLLLLFLNATVTIQSGTVGVVSVLGAVRDNTLGAGFHVKAPFITNVTKMDIQTQKTEVSTSAASKDLQNVAVVAAINYHIDSRGASTLYREVGMSYEQKIIAPMIQEVIKSVIARFSAEELITMRQTVSVGIKDELSNKLNEYSIITDEFNIINFDFSAEFNNAVEAKQTAQQEALKAQQELARITIEAQQQVEQAKAEAEATKARADAEAYATKAKAEAEAYAIEAIQSRLAQSPDSYLEYQKTQKWDGKLPVVSGSSGTFIDIGSIIE